MRFFGEEPWSSRIISTTEYQKILNTCLRVPEADGRCSYLLVMWAVANGESISKAKTGIPVAAERSEIVLMGDLIALVISAC